MYLSIVGALRDESDICDGPNSGAVKSVRVGHAVGRAQQRADYIMNSEQSQERYGTTENCRIHDGAISVHEMR